MRQVGPDRRRLLAGALCGGLAAAGLGRASAAPPPLNPTDTPGQQQAEEDVVALWRDERVRRARDQVAMRWRECWGDTPPAEVRPLLDPWFDEFVTYWLFKAVASDPNYPRFVREAAAPHRWRGLDVPGARAGLDNPDNCYRTCGVAHGVRYRITARPLAGKPANASFTVKADHATSTTIQTIEAHQLVQDRDGGFTLTIDEEPAGGRPNHLTTRPGANRLLVRDSMEDWAREAPYFLTIERLGQPAAAPMTREEMLQRGVRDAIDNLPLYFWFQACFTSMRPNSWVGAQGGRGTGGLVTQTQAKGNFRVADDEAVIIDYEPAGALYVSLQISTWAFYSLGTGKVQSSLTRAQSAIDPDGRVRAVIAKHDPGVANWLDTDGFETILLAQRWQGLPAQPVRGGPNVNMQVVKLADLRSALPPQTRWLTPRERADQLSRRNAAFARRFATA